MKTVCVTGHREIPADKLDYIILELRREVGKAIEDGYTTFLSGFADGADLEFAEIVADIKKSNPAVSLEAAIPYYGRMKAKDPRFQTLIKRCDKVHIICEEYSSDCYRIRNGFLVERSQRVIAVFSGKTRSGTAQTMRMARENGRELRTIPV